jgi:hypothetical protein
MAGVARVTADASTTVVPFEPAALRELSALGALKEYSGLKSALEAGKWKVADEETAKILRRAVGRRNPRAKDIERLSCDVFNAIDGLWLQYSNGRFGFSTQGALYQSGGGLVARRGYDPVTFGRFARCTDWLTTRKLGREVESALLGSVHLRYDISAPPGHLPAAWVLPRHDTLFSRGKQGVWSSIGILIATLLYGAAAAFVLGVIGLVLLRLLGLVVGVIIGLILALHFPAEALRRAREGKRTMQAADKLMVLFSRLQSCGLPATTAPKASATAPRARGALQSGRAK